MKILSYPSAKTEEKKKEKKKAEGFEISLFYWSFSSDIARGSEGVNQPQPSSDRVSAGSASVT